MALVRGAEVLAHVQAFADLTETVGATSWGTYHGHGDTPSPADDLDIFTRDIKVGDAICDLALRHKTRYGVVYVIWRQRINSGDGRGWRLMVDLGDDTQNHFDHVHITFTAEPPPGFRAEPDQEDEMAPPLIGYLYAVNLGTAEDPRGSLWFLPLFGRSVHVTEMARARKLAADGAYDLGEVPREWHLRWSWTP